VTAAPMSPAARPRSRWPGMILGAALVSLVAACGAPTPSAAPAPREAALRAGPAASDAPGQAPWRAYADPQEAGFDPAALDAICTTADSARSGAFMAVYRGHVLLACGDVSRPLEAHSVRKSLLSGLYGTAVERGKVRLGATLDELGIDDGTRLTPGEKAATVRDLISARSGVYLPAAYAPASQSEERPERGSHPPGTHWFYNNWDFNVAGVVYEHATGEELYGSFQERIARPLGMEDWTPADGFRACEPTLSRHPAHTFRMSTRDLARFGQLYLQGGRWAGRELLPEAWVEESTRAHSDLGDGAGYGYMWWTYDAGALNPDRYPELSGHDLFMGRGTGGQALWVIPDAEMVVVHRGDTDHGLSVSGAVAWGMVEQLLAARDGEPVASPRLGPVRPRPLASQLPPVAMPEYRQLPESDLEQYVGHYEIAPGTVARVYLFHDRPYMHVPGEGDALLFHTGGDSFTVRVVPGVTVAFERAADGEVVAVELTLGEQTVRGARVQSSAYFAPQRRRPRERSRS
jgi:CubicO group peptidase (beta-lactamase class C family)